jgi:hypothetical protein
MRATQRWNYNGFFGAHRDVELEPGVLNQEARDVFCRGHCHSLALALTDLLPGAELVAVYSGDPVADHILVRLPDGRLLDANGAQDDDDVTAGYGGFEDDAWIEEISGEDIYWLEDSDNYRRNRVEDALPFAQALLEREGLTEQALALAA